MQGEDSLESPVSTKKQRKAEETDTKAPANSLVPDAAGDGAKAAGVRQHEHLAQNTPRDSSSRASDTSSNDNGMGLAAETTTTAVTAAKMRTIHGDLIEMACAGHFDVIVHGCNCFNTMGAGIARQIKKTFPAAYAADQRTMRGDRGKLGTYTSARCDVPLSSSPPPPSSHQHHTVTVVNAYTQYRYNARGGKSDLVEYDALESVFGQIKDDFPGRRVGFPKIGAGLAGGDWPRIAKIIRQQLHPVDYYLVLYQQTKTKGRKKGRVSR